LQTVLCLEPLKLGLANHPGKLSLPFLKFFSLFLLFMLSISDFSVDSLKISKNLLDLPLDFLNIECALFVLDDGLLVPFNFFCENLHAVMRLREGL
jgi:hypothetical protein